MRKSIGIKISRNFFYPEAFAYQKYLAKFDYGVKLIKHKNDLKKYDIIIKFMGLDFNINQKNKIIIHDYASLSTGKLAKIKNKIKKNFNIRPNARIFLNKTVRDEMNFNDNIPFIYRDMGIDKEFFFKTSIKKKYDILYCGTFKNRPGLINIIRDLANKKLSIVLIGDISNKQKAELCDIKNIKILGKIPRELIYQIYYETRVGLNFYPNIYPYNIQTSTKVLEYFAAGMGVISNSYEWINKFEYKLDCKILYYNKLLSKEKILHFDYKKPNLKNYEWNKYLASINFEKFIDSLII